MQIVLVVKPHNKNQIQNAMAGGPRKLRVEMDFASTKGTAVAEATCGFCDGK